MAKTHKIFIGLHEIAGYYTNLACGMRTIGVDVQYITLSDHVFGYSGSDTNSFIRLLKFVGNCYSRTPRKKFFQKIFWIGMYDALLFGFFIQNLLKYDVFIFGFGRSFFWNNMDLPFLRLFGKKIIFNMSHGSELRPPYIDGARQSEDGRVQPSERTLYKIAKKLIFRIRKIEKYADYIIGAPFSSTQFSQAKLINIFAIGLPFFQHQRNAVKFEGGNRIRILHSPSHPAAKGSDRIRQIVNQLCEKGHVIDFIELRGRPNSEVLEELSRCDFVIDQIYSDTPMAGFATEAALFGKPAVVGGYGFNELKKYIPDGMFPPSQICHPDGLEKAIEQLIVDPEYRKKLGEEARDFVQTQWSASIVAERYMQIISGHIPESWLLDPKDVVYLHGCGQQEACTKENIRRIVKSYGAEALQLSHRPDLEQAFLEFAGLSRS